MGFYGNITNTSRTQFSFDKIYPNKYELFKKAKTDGIYVGRYVLVEYDLDTGADTFLSTLYKQGDNMYTNLLVSSTIGDTFYPCEIDPQSIVKSDDIINGTTIENGTIIRLLPYHNMSNVNDSHVCINITSVDEENNTFTYQAVTEFEYEEWVNTQLNGMYSPVSDQFTSSNYETGVYYIKNEDEEYELSWDYYDANQTYYQRGLNNKFWIISNLDTGFFKIVYNQEAPHENYMYLIPRGCMFDINETEELWSASIKKDEETGISFLTWNQLAANDNSNYYKNFNIDQIAYPNAHRGYDSTVWQKIYHSGEQYYIMIAELNTIVPNFELDTEAPQLIPINPHYDTDSTNIYYRIKMTPQWGFRTKAASSALLTGEIKKDGSSFQAGNIPLRDDEINYPSDISIIWKNKFYNKETDEIVEKYYNPNTGTWENYNEETNYRLKSAIYFNKDGFNPEEVSYSADILNAEHPKYNSSVANSGWINENSIDVSATGYSGKLYSAHNGSEERIPQIDTQELSIMIPALGDSIAQMWDIVYGGRKTNNQINETNKRNLDIAWENANNSILRQGLRLIRDIPGENGFNQSYDNAETDFQGNIINAGEINTLAGCINSVHDLMGMILVNTSQENLQNQQKELQGSDVFKDYKNIDGSKIYYFANDGTYRRKHETFTYKEVQYIYEPVELNEGNFIKNFYYYSTDGGETFIPSYDDDFDENRNYYLKKMDATVAENQVFIPVSNLKAFNAGEKHFPYQKTLNGDFIYDESLYAKDNETIYYNVTNILNNKMTLSGDYEPNKYFYCNDEDYIEGKFTKWQLEQAEEASNIQYYMLDINPVNKNLQDPEDMYDDVGRYFYCPGYFYYKKYDLLTQTPNISNVGNYYKRVNPIVYADQSELVNVPNYMPTINISSIELYNMDNTTNYVYVPLTSEGENWDYQYDGTEVRWNPDLYEGNIIKNIYVESNSLMLDQADKLSVGREYYIVFKEEAGEISSFIDDGNGGLIPAVSATAYNINKYRVIMNPYMANNYYRIGDGITTYLNPLTGESLTEEQFLELDEDAQLNYSPVTQVSSYKLMTESTALAALNEDYANQFKEGNKKFITYYTIINNATEAFYGPNRYWYNTYQDKLETDEEKDSWEIEGSINDRFAYGDWIVDSGKKMTEGRRYYLTVQSTPESGPYYHPNYYYYYDNNLEQYVLDFGTSMQTGITYYEKNNFYILEDKTGRFTKGAIWKYYDTGIPCVIKIASRQSVYEMQELKGFARTFNTIHGLILKINDLLEIDDTLTRDTSTLQGCINTLNDIIYKFDELEFNKILFTDQTGRITTKDIKDIEIAYGPGYSKKMTLAQMLVKFEEIEEKVDNLIFMTDAEMNAIINN